MSDMHSDTERALTFPCDGRHVLCAYVMRDMSNPRGARLNVCNVCLYSFAQGRDLMKPGSCSMSDIKNVIRSRQVASLRRQDTNVNASNERTPGAVRSRAACTRLYVYCTLTEVRTGTRPGRIRVDSMSDIALDLSTRLRVPLRRQAHTWSKERTMTDIEGLLSRLTPEEKGWFLDLVYRLKVVEGDMGRSFYAQKPPRPEDLVAWATEVRKVWGFLDQVLYDYPKPGCAHRETPLPKRRVTDEPAPAPTSKSRRVPAKKS